MQVVTTISSEIFSGRNAKLEAKLRRVIDSIAPIDAGEVDAMKVDTIVPAVIAVFILLVESALFMLNRGLNETCGSAAKLFLKLHAKEGSNLTKLVIFVALEATKYYADKIVINLYEGGQII